MEKKKILIIDDDKIFTKILIDSLPPDKYDVVTSNDGEDGLDKMHSLKPDMIILDLRMPKMGGLEFLSALKKEPEANKVPILISSQFSSMTDISEAVTSGIGVGVKGYIIKATENMDMIVKTIEKTLS